jgi:Flp pilus assembly protein TadG
MPEITMKSLRVRAREYFCDRRGNVSMMFGLTLVPLLMITGGAIDYARVAAVRAKLDNAADLATLASLSPDAQPFVTTPTQASVEAYFNAISNTVPNVSNTAVTVTVASNETNLAVTLSYTTQVRTAFAGIIGINDVTIGGKSTAQTQSPLYYDFYLLLDNSPSMGLAASAADISHLESLTPDNCAFACHQHTYNAQGQVTGDDLSDDYHVAKNASPPVTLRIDVLRQAVQQMATAAATTEITPNQFRMSAWEFSDTFTEISGLMTNLTAFSNAISVLDIAYAWNTNCCAQTNFDQALKSMNNAIPAPGNGLNPGPNSPIGGGVGLPNNSPNGPQEFLFIVTDGVEDTTAPTSSTQGSYVAGSNRYIGLLNPSLCQTIKNKGVVIGILYTPYLALPTNGAYSLYVAPVADQIPTNLQSCASPNFFFEVTPTQGISQGLQAMFQTAVTYLHLTQ